MVSRDRWSSSNAAASSTGEADAEDSTLRFPADRRASGSDAPGTESFDGVASPRQEASSPLFNDPAGLELGATGPSERRGVRATGIRSRRCGEGVSAWKDARRPAPAATWLHKGVVGDGGMPADPLTEGDDNDPIAGNDDP